MLGFGYKFSTYMLSGLPTNTVLGNEKSPKGYVIACLAATKLVITVGYLELPQFLQAQLERPWGEIDSLPTWIILGSSIGSIALGFNQASVNSTRANRRQRAIGFIRVALYSSLIVWMALILSAYSERQECHKLLIPQLAFGSIGFAAGAVQTYLSGLMWLDKSDASDDIRCTNIAYVNGCAVMAETIAFFFMKRLLILIRS